MIIKTLQIETMLQAGNDDARVIAANSLYTMSYRSRWHRWSQVRATGNPGTIGKALATAW